MDNYEVEIDEEEMALIVECLKSSRLVASAWGDKKRANALCPIIDALERALEA